MPRRCDGNYHALRSVLNWMGSTKRLAEVRFADDSVDGPVPFSGHGVAFMHFPVGGGDASVLLQPGEVVVAIPHHLFSQIGTVGGVPQQ